MKRNMDLVREILLEIEAQPAGKLIRNVSLPEKWNKEEVVGHLRLIGQAGLDDGKMEFHREAVLIAIHGLSNEGHDLLDSIRSEAVWQKTKDRVEEVGGSVALDKSYSNGPLRPSRSRRFMVPGFPGRGRFSLPAGRGFRRGGGRVRDGRCRGSSKSNGSRPRA